MMSMFNKTDLNSLKPIFISINNKHVHQGNKMLFLRKNLKLSGGKA